MVILGEFKTFLVFQIGRFVKKMFKIKVGGISLDTLYITRVSRSYVTKVKYGDLFSFYSIFICAHC